MAYSKKLGIMIDDSTVILFFDGSCGFCNRSVQFILSQERDKKIHFTQLQSPYTASLFKEMNLPEQDLTTIYFLKNKKMLSKSQAVFEIIPHLKWYWQPLRIFKLLPKSWTDALYSFIAKRRTKLALPFCMVPDPFQAKRFIA